MISLAFHLLQGHIFHNHGALGPFDELWCFGALLIVALGVAIVYGRDLIQPAGSDPACKPTTEEEGKA